VKNIPSYKTRKKKKKKQLHKHHGYISIHEFSLTKKNDKVTSIKQNDTRIRNLNKKSSKVMSFAQCHNPFEAPSIVYKEVHINHYHETHYHHMIGTQYPSLHAS